MVELVVEAGCVELVCGEERKKLQSYRGPYIDVCMGGTTVRSKSEERA